MDLDQIEKLNELKEKGMISEEEYQQTKARILGSAPPAKVASTMNSNDYCLMMHLSQFCSWIFPLVGIIVPLIMWQTKKDDAYIDQQGRVVMNWICSALIYAMVSAVLCLIVVGIFMLIALAICSIVFTIMGALDAQKGIVKNYPLTIKFFEVQETPRAV